MATLEKVDHTAVAGSVEELSALEDAVWEQPYKTPDRRHVEALVDVSEEDFLKELEPYEYHCYSGWEEAVRGWARVAPLSGILVAHKTYRKPKHTDADNPAPLATDPVTPDAGSYASTVEHCCESHMRPRNTLKKSTSGSWSNTETLQKDASERPVLNATQKATSALSLEKKMEEEGMLRETPLQNRTPKPQRQSHRPKNKLVSVKNFTFLPPIESPHLNPRGVRGLVGSGKKFPEGEITEENVFLFDRRSERMRGTRGEPVANPELPTYNAGLSSKFWTCQHSPHLFSADSISIPKRYQVPISSTAHRTSFLMGKTLTQALHTGRPAGAQARLHPNKTVCSPAV